MTGHWAALLPATDTGEGVGGEGEGAGSAFSPPSAHDLGVWLLQFTPRVALHEDAVLIEAAASLRLFGGARALRRRIRTEAAALGVHDLGWAQTGLGALALARARRQGWRPPSQSAQGEGAASLLPGLVSDALPLETVSALARHRPTLARLGCRTVGDVRRLPRQGMARRFDAALLLALDQLAGQAPEACDWLALPEVFEARLELLARVEDGPALMTGVQRLLVQLQGWLRARQAGALAVTLHWRHDTFRARGSGPGGQLTVRTAQPTQSMAHLGRLLAEHLARVELAAPVSDLVLQVHEFADLAPDNAVLMPDPAARGEPLALALERIAARLGPQVLADHRLAWMQQWQPANDAMRGQPAAAPRRLPLPPWQIEPPQPLAMQGGRPCFERAPLRLLLGPDRVETGWWHRAGLDEQQAMMVARDYWLACCPAQPAAGLLWVFRQRPANEAGGWFLHGRFG